MEIMIQKEGKCDYQEKNEHNVPSLGVKLESLSSVVSYATGCAIATFNYYRLGQ